MLARSTYVTIGALLAAIAALRFGVTAELPLALYLAGVTAPLVDTDVREHRLPNTVVLPAYPIGFAGLLASSERLLPLIACGGALAVFALLHVIGGLGMGDVKLAGALALSLATLGGAPLILGLVLPFLLGGAVAVVLLLAGRRGDIPFGPYLLAGYWLAVAAIH
ncbi:prepilin peptidase [Microbacteriaceae bacterium VKM Ac-2854]|nr:prepilin peptidase [Microbacteriaceae bacterium VKM Ac-2854]